MLQASGDPDLPEESLRAERGGELGAQDLEGDGPIVPEIVSEIDGGHAAASELALDAIAIGQGGREEVGRLGQRGNRRMPYCVRMGYRANGLTVSARCRVRWFSARLVRGTVAAVVSGILSRADVRAATEAHALAWRPSDRGI